MAVPRFEKLFYVAPGKKFSLQDVDPDFCDGYQDERDIEARVRKDVKRMSELQDIFYADNRYSMLLIFQAMDTAGKDGAIKHIFSGVNPQGCKVTSFKHPSEAELEHDYLWRHVLALPEKGQIGIFNRSYYENVLICKVHPELNLFQRIPGINTVDDIGKRLWDNRYGQIREFERNLVENGTLVLKFFLHISKDEQKKRLLKRIENPDKHWKFSYSDIEERKHWDAYMQAYQKALNETSSKWAPWYVIPANNKWFGRMAIASIVLHTLESLSLQYPSISAEEKAKLRKAEKELKMNTGQ